jgi:hypothetical protein
MIRRFDEMAAAVDRTLPETPRLGVIGSSPLIHPDSESPCVLVGRGLASMCSLGPLSKPG